jgi:hypothetical protein
MDRWEVGGLIVPEIFIPALQSVQLYSEDASTDQAAEVLRSASAFFDGVDSGLIWGKLIHLVTSALDSNVTAHDEALSRMRLAKFILARFNLKEEDMLLHHMPLMVLSTLASLNVAYEDANRAPLDPALVDLAFEITESLVQIVPERALRGEDNPTQRSPQNQNISREATFQQLRAFYEDSQGSLDATDPPFSATALGQSTLREAVRTFKSSLHGGAACSSPDISARILASLIFKTQHLGALDDNDLFNVFQHMLAKPPEDSTQLSFGQLSAITTVLMALQTSLPTKPYLPVAQVPELVYPIIAKFWQYLSPATPKFHVETTRCILHLHAISPHSRMVEAAVASIVQEQLSHKSNDHATSDCGRHFATLWTHTMHELNVQSEKRGSIARRPSGHIAQTPILAPAEYDMILTRPLLLLLDTLEEDGIETSAFMRSWLQDLPTLGRVFDILVHHIQSLQCVARADSLATKQTLPVKHAKPRRDDSRDCLYYMRHIYNILKRPSHFTWVTLAETPAASVDDSSTRASLQEWIVRTCLETMALQVEGIEESGTSHIAELHRISVSIISRNYQSPFSTPLRQLELEVPLMDRLTTAVSSLQSLLLEATLLALRSRLTQPSQDRPVEPKNATQPSHRPRLSLALNRDSEDNMRTPIPPPPQLIDCLKFGFSSTMSRVILDDWVHFLIEVLPLFADTIFQNLLPLVECFCKEITSCFAQLKSTFASRASVPDMSPESTLISLINGLEQILAKAHDRLTIQESKASATKSPEQPQGFFSNVVSGVFSSESPQTRTPTANSRLTVLLCFQDTVRICFSIWSWGGYGQKQGQHDVSSAASFGFTSLRMRNRARRILEHLFAAEALECLETLAVLWSKATVGDDQGTAILGLLNVLNGSKPKHTIPAIFNAVYSRTDPSALEPTRASTLTSDLSDAELVAFLVDYTKSLEDDAMDEIWQDCTLFLRDVLANPLPHRQILPMLLEFTAVIGQKVDNTNFGEQRKMRRELAVSSHIRCTNRH